MTDPHTQRSADTPPELRPMELALDELAARERAGAPASMEDRIALATARRLGRRAEPASPPVAARIAPHGRLLALAACLALAGLVGAVALLQQRPAQDNDVIARLADLGDEIDLLLVSPFPYDTDERLTALQTEINRFEASFVSWPFDDDPLDLYTLEGTLQ